MIGTCHISLAIIADANTIQFKFTVYCGESACLSGLGLILFIDIVAARPYKESK